MTEIDLKYKMYLEGSVNYNPDMVPGPLKLVFEQRKQVALNILDGKDSYGLYRDLWFCLNAEMASFFYIPTENDFK